MTPEPKGPSADAIRSQLDGSGERNLFLFLLLGLEARGQRFDRWLADVLASSHPRRAPCTDMLLVHFVLGLAHARRTFRTEVEQLAVPPPPVEAANTEKIDRGWLR